MSFLVLAERSGMATQAGMDFWNYSKLTRELQEYEARNQQFTSASATFEHRLMHKSTVVEAVIQGQITFNEACDVFQKMYEHDPHMLNCLLEHYQTDDVQEACARNVLMTVLPSLMDRAADCQLRAQLLTEYSCRFPQATGHKHMELH